MRAGGDEETAIRQYGVPASEFGDALRSIKAQKQILVIDACQSGAALSTITKLLLTKGLREADAMDKAMRGLAGTQGIYLIAAATEKQNALEINGHGVLTSAFLSGLGENGHPQATTSSDGSVTIMALLRWVNLRVRELTERHFKQSPVWSGNGNDFTVWAW
jgi:hypothetical protein